MDAQELRQRLLDASAGSTGEDAWEPLRPDFSAWGWAELPTSLGGSNEDCTGPFAFAEALAASRAYHSQHCGTALAEQLGLEGLHEGMAGSACMPGLGNEGSVEQLRSGLKQHINAAWSTEAVRQGVQHAKSGAYEEAHKCYAKALELEQGNADAYVARGAAYANQGHFGSAINDFQHALSLDPGNANADKYCRAVQQRAAAQGSAQALTPPHATLQRTQHTNHPGAPAATPAAPAAAAAGGAAGAAGVAAGAAGGAAGARAQEAGPVQPITAVRRMSAPIGHTPLAAPRALAKPQDNFEGRHGSKGAHSIGDVREYHSIADVREGRDMELGKRSRQRSRSHASSDGSSSSSGSSTPNSSLSSSQGSESDEGQQGPGEQMDEVQRALHLVMMSRRKDKGRDREGHKGKHRSRKDKGKEKRKDKGKDKRRSKHKKKKKKRK